MKEIFDNYTEQPSEDVWRRLSERLDTEMPVHPVRRSWRKTWLWTAAAVAGLTIGGVVFTLTRHHASDAAETVKNPTQQVVADLQEEAVTEVFAAEETTEEAVLEPVADAEVSPAEKKTEPAQESVSREEKIEPKSNVRQIVLPANSTLAKQLAEDPVLRTLSPDAVDWSMPIHLSIPNLFTPNGDGVNDLFVIEGIEQYSAPKLVIRDKNNRVVYKSDSYQNTWGGGDCPDGAYNYEFTFVYNGIENQATGKVRIKRS